jgi:hypothetical protein
VKTGSKCICAVCRQQEPMQELGAFPFQKAVRARSVVCGVGEEHGGGVSLCVKKPAGWS